MGKTHVSLLVLALCCTGFTVFAGKPERKYEKTPADFNLKYKQDSVLTADAIRLSVWDYEPAGKDSVLKPVIVMAYGDAGNMSYWIEQASALVTAGYRVITFDYRGYGTSDDFLINENQLYYNEFGDDLVAVLDYTKSKYPNQKCGFYGLSMGTLVGVLALSKTKTTIDFFIGEGFVVNPHKIAEKLTDFKSQKIILPNDTATFSDKLASIPTKMLIFAGKYDPITTLADAQQLTLNDKNKQLVEFKGGHLQGLDVMKDKYVKSIQLFLEKVLD
jgi:pimeloyl-ACP methyl ester carboxylesterase